MEVKVANSLTLFRFCVSGGSKLVSNVVQGARKSSHHVLIRADYLKMFAPALKWGFSSVIKHVSMWIELKFVMRNESNIKTK
jgi:hypothetical protein